MPFDAPLVTVVSLTLAKASDMNTNFGALNTSPFDTISSDSGDLTSDGQGNLLFGGYLGVIGQGDVIDAASFRPDSGIWLKARNAGKIHFQTPNGTTQMHVDAGGLHANFPLTVANFYEGSIGRVGHFTGAGDGRVHHGLSITPTWLAPVCTVAGHWDVYGYTHATATTVYIISFRNLSYLAWVIR